jgi:hopene-associated glycosyltransferase HpnB
VFQPLLLGLGVASLALWLAVLLHPARPWALRPVAEDEPDPPEPSSWPPVSAIVPARNEAAYLPRTLPALLAQEYRGSFEVVVVDDRSEDDTAHVAAVLGAHVLVGAALPESWVGKVWALEQGLQATSGDAEYLLLTDADILHAADSLRALVAESEAGRLALNSRMARLRARSPSERLLVPAFLYFFNLLYPMPRANSGRRPAAAGGCILLRRDALERAGGFRAVRGEVIDDLGLARRVAAGGRIRLAVSRRTVVSVREHPTVRSIWAMVARTAFTELRHSWPRLAAALFLLALMFPVPPLLVASFPLEPPAAVLGLAAWATMTTTFLPAVRFFGLSPAWAPTLPLAGLLYGAMTLSSALASRSARAVTPEERASKQSPGSTTTPT